MTLLTPMDLKRLVCEGTDLDQYVYFGSQAEKEAFQNICCALSPQQLINSQQVLLQNLQPRKVLSEVRFPFFSHLVSKWSLVLFGHLEDYFCQASKIIIYVGHNLLVDFEGSLGRSQKDRENHLGRNSVIRKHGGSCWCWIFFLYVLCLTVKHKLCVSVLTLVRSAVKSSRYKADLTLNQKCNEQNQSIL